jgi:hypothetical protein
VQPDVRYENVEGFPGYRVGEDGSVWSRRNVGCKGGIGRVWKRLKPQNCKGYRLVSLRKNRKTFMRQVHRLVLEAFVGQCPKGMECCHKNDIPSDNRLSNLRWDTSKGNSADCVNHGNSLKGTKNHHAKLTDRKVANARRLYASGGYILRELAAMNGVSREVMGKAIKGKTWKHVSLRG